MAQPRYHHQYLPDAISAEPDALSAEEVTQNVRRMRARIPSDLWSELKREKLLDPKAPTQN